MNAIYCFLSYIFMIFLLNLLILEAQQDQVSNKKISEINRITNEIDEFKNNNKQSELKKLILRYFNKLTSEDLDSLIIVSEPVFEINPKYKVNYVDSTELGSINPKVIITSHLFKYLLKSDSNNQTIYSSLMYPILNQDSLRISFRIYTKSRFQKYYIEIIDPSDFQDIVPETGKYEAGIDKLICELHDNLKSIPYEIESFSIDINSYNLQRCIIYEGKIYSLNCIQEKFDNLSLNEILKYHLKEIEECDFDINFTKINYTYLKKTNINK